MSTKTDFLTAERFFANLILNFNTSFREKTGAMKKDLFKEQLNSHIDKLFSDLETDELFINSIPFPLDKAIFSDLYRFYGDSEDQTYAITDLLFACFGGDFPKDDHKSLIANLIMNLTDKDIFHYMNKNIHPDRIEISMKLKLSADYGKPDCPICEEENCLEEKISFGAKEWDCPYCEFSALKENCILD